MAGINNKCPLPEGFACCGAKVTNVVTVSDSAEAGILALTENGVPARLITPGRVPKELIYALGKESRSILHFEWDLTASDAFPRGIWDAMRMTAYCGVTFFLYAYHILPGMGHQSRIFDAVQRFMGFGGIGYFFFRFYDEHSFPYGADTKYLEKSGKIWRPTPEYATEFARRLTVYGQCNRRFHYGICGVTPCNIFNDKGE